MKHELISGYVPHNIVVPYESIKNKLYTKHKVTPLDIIHSKITSRHKLNYFKFFYKKNKQSYISPYSHQFANSLSNVTLNDRPSNLINSNMSSILRSVSFKNNFIFRFMHRVMEFSAHDLLNQQLTNQFGHYFDAVWGVANAPTVVSFVSSGITGIAEGPAAVPMNVFCGYVSSNMMNKLNKSLHDIWMGETQKFYQDFYLNTMINVIGTVSLYTASTYLTSQYQIKHKLSFLDKIKINFAAAFANSITTHPLLLLQENNKAISLITKPNIKHNVKIISSLVKQQGLMNTCKSVFFKTVALGVTMLMVEEALKKTREIY